MEHDGDTSHESPVMSATGSNDAPCRRHASSAAALEQRLCAPGCRDPAQSWEAFSQTVEDEVAAVDDHMDADRIPHAYEVVTRVRDSMQWWQRVLDGEAVADYDESVHGDAPDGESFAWVSDMLEGCATLFDTVVRMASEIEVLVTRLRSDEGWILARDKGGTRTLYRQGEDTPTIEVKMEGEVDSPLFNVCAVVNESALWLNWVPRLAESTLVRQLGRYRKVIRIRASVPVISDRDAVLFGYGVDMLDKGVVLIVARSATESDVDSNDLEPPKRGVVRMAIHEAGMLLVPISRERTHVTVFANVDPMLSVIPYWLINFGTKQIAHLMFQMMVTQCKKVDAEDSPYAEPIASNDAVYGQLKRRLTAFFE